MSGPLYPDQRMLANQLSIASLMGCIMSPRSVSSGSGMGSSEAAAEGINELGLLRPTLLVTLGPSCNLVPSHSRVCSSVSSLGTWAHADYMKVFGMWIFRAGWLVNPCPKQWAGCWTRVWLWQRAVPEGKQTARLRKYSFHVHPLRQEAKKLCTAAHGITIMAHLVYS